MISIQRFDFCGFFSSLSPLRLMLLDCGETNAFVAMVVKKRCLFYFSYVGKKSENRTILKNVVYNLYNLKLKLRSSAPPPK